MLANAYSNDTGRPQQRPITLQAKCKHVSPQITDIGASLSRDEMHLKPAAKSETMASVMSSIRT